MSYHTTCDEDADEMCPECYHAMIQRKLAQARMPRSGWAIRVSARRRRTENQWWLR